MDYLRNIFIDFKLTHMDVPRIESQVFFDGPDRRRSLERFAVLLFFAVLIASYGVIVDSTATVIGAMLIAPLMTPILAIAVALVTGQTQRAIQSLVIVVSGVAGSIALAWWIGFTYRTGVLDSANNSQIMSRVSPGLVDLYAALGAGAIGAFATSRKDIADTLPGAAIAIALAPPLAVVGLTLSLGEWSHAWGAMLLFLTNFFAILIAGSATLALLGLSAAATRDLQGSARRKAFTWIAVGAILVIIPLATTSYNAVLTAQNKNRVTESVLTWIEGTEYKLIQIQMRPDGAIIRIGGEDELPPTEELIREIQQRLQRQLQITLEVIPAHTETLTVPEVTLDDD